MLMIQSDSIDEDQFLYDSPSKLMCHSLHYSFVMLNSRDVGVILIQKCQVARW